MLFYSAHVTIPAMKIFAITSLKGGVGKTTSTIHLATVSALMDELTIVIDADEEGSSLRWSAHATDLPFKVIPFEKDRLAQQAKTLKSEGFNVFIDTPPNNREILTRTSMIADTVIVPVIPTGLDVDRMMPTLALLRDIQASTNVDIAIVFTRFDSRKVLAQEARVALEGYPVLSAKIRDLTRYEQAFGMTPVYIFEYLQVWSELNG